MTSVNVPPRSIQNCQRSTVLTSLLVRSLTATLPPPAPTRAARSRRRAASDRRRSSRGGSARRTGSDNRHVRRVPPATRCCRRSRRRGRCARRPRRRGCARCGRRPWRSTVWRHLQACPMHLLSNIFSRSSADLAAARAGSLSIIAGTWIVATAGSMKPATNVTITTPPLAGRRFRMSSGTLRGTSQISARRRVRKNHRRLRHAQCVVHRAIRDVRQVDQHADACSSRARPARRMASGRRAPAVCAASPPNSRFTL